MKINQCCMCDYMFKEDEQEVISTTYEHFYGVDDLFSNGSRCSIVACPNCSSSRIEEIEVEDEQEIEANNDKIFWERFRK